MINFSCTIESRSSTLPIVKIVGATVEKTILPIREHSHNNFEIAYFTGGNAVYHIDGKDYDISSGDVFVFSSNEQHCITEIKSDLTYTVIHFDPKYLWGSSSDSLSVANTNFCLMHSPDFCNRLPRESAVTEQIGHAILNAAQELQNKESEYKMMVKNYINEIIVLLIRKMDYISQQNDTPMLSQINSIKKVIKYIDSHLSESITLGEISNIAEMSPNYFCTVFKQINGVTAWDYITAKRCDMAAHLLLSESECNVIEIAERCGFNNTANFNKAFRKKTGMTPSQYRKSGDMF